MLKRKVPATEWSDRLLLINLYLTQGIILLVSAVSIYFLFIRKEKNVLALIFSDHMLRDAALGAFTACVLIGFYLLIYRALPKRYFDDGGINEKLFARRSIPHIIAICVLVAVSEELLFRGIVQTTFGLWIATALFTIVHTRYLTRWLMTSVTFFIGLCIGGLYAITGHLIAPMTAHFFINAVMAVMLKKRIGVFASDGKVS